MKPENYMKKMMIEPLRGVMKIADTVFQKRRRMEEASKLGIVRCISCGVFGNYKSFDAGHYIPRKHYGVRYDPRNVWPQCKKCNDWLGGNHAKYEDALLKKLGPVELQELKDNKDKAPKFLKEFMINVIIESRIKIKELEQNGIY